MITNPYTNKGPEIRILPLKLVPLESTSKVERKLAKEDAVVEVWHAVMRWLYQDCE